MGGKWDAARPHAKCIMIQNGRVSQGIYTARKCTGVHLHPLLYGVLTWQIQCQCCLWVMWVKFIYNLAASQVLVETWDPQTHRTSMMAVVCDPTAAAAAAATSSGLAGAPRAGPGSSDARAPLRLAVHLARAAGAGAAACRSTRGERLGARIG